MNRVRKAFTMVELIFVIVILGILAVVAILRLAATREDAAGTVALASFKTAVHQVQADATAKGVIPADLTRIITGNPNLAVDADSFTAQSVRGGAVTVCAVGTVIAADQNLSIDVQTVTGPCVLFAQMVDSKVPLLGAVVNRQ